MDVRISLNLYNSLIIFSRSIRGNFCNIRKSSLKLGISSGINEFLLHPTSTVKYLIYINIIANKCKWINLRLYIIKNYFELVNTGYFTEELAQTIMH